MAIAFKRRTPEGEPTVIDLVGDVQGRPAIIFDDMIQSGGTLLQVVDILFARGATEVCVAAVHADFIPGVVSRLRSSRIKTLLISDTTSAGQGLRVNKIQVVSAARILAHAIWRIHTEQTVGWIFDTLKKGEELPPVVRHGG
jgi:ribose-phosphate pyrophosphokinase